MPHQIITPVFGEDDQTIEQVISMISILSENTLSVLNGQSEYSMWLYN